MQRKSNGLKGVAVTRVLRVDLSEEEIIGKLSKPSAKRLATLVATMRKYNPEGQYPAQYMLALADMVKRIGWLESTSSKLFSRQEKARRARPFRQPM